VLRNPWNLIDKISRKNKKSSLPHRIPARNHPLDKLIRFRVRNHKNIRRPGHRNIQEPLLQIGIGRSTGGEQVGPHHEDDAVLQSFGRCHGPDLDGLPGNPGAGIVILVQPGDRCEAAEIVQEPFENFGVFVRFSDVEDAYVLGLQGYFDIIERDIAVQEDVCDGADPFAFIGMVLAPEENRLWPPADGLVRVHRHDRDRVLVVLYVLRGKMCGKAEDLAGGKRGDYKSSAIKKIHRDFFFRRSFIPAITVSKSLSSHCLRSFV